MRGSDRYEECIRKGLLKKVEPSLDSSMDSLRIAEEWLGEAEKNREIGSYRSAYSSAYMCFFHSARAVLFRDGFREKSHYCLGVYLDHLSIGKEIEPVWAMMFDNVRNSRHNEQYNFSGPPTLSEVQAVIADARTFMERMRNHLRK